MRFEQIHRFGQQQRYPGLFAFVAHQLQSGGRIRERIQAKDEHVHAGFDEGIDPGERICRHQVHFERMFRARSQSGDEIGKEKHRRRVVAVGDIEMVAFGVRIHAFDLSAEVREIGRL